MERRVKERHARRLKIHFQERGSAKSHLGYTVNISATGVYIVTGHLSAKGIRLRLQLSSEEEASVMLEGVVVRTHRSVQSEMPSGMAVRFLDVEELVEELLPDLAASPTLDTPEGAYRMRFADRKQFLFAYERDLSTGGLFIPLDEPPQIGDTIQVELSIVDTDEPPVLIEARVVHRLDPSMPDGTRGNLLAGVGVEIQELDSTLRKLRPLVERSRS